MVGDILQPTHLLFILIVALLVLGPKRLPEVARQLGSGIRDFRAAISGEQTSTPEPQISQPVPASEPPPVVATEPPPEPPAPVPPPPVPADEMPAQESPAHEPPAHEPPAHEPLAHEPPAHESPAHETPAYEPTAPAHEPTAHEQPAEPAPDPTQQLRVPATEVSNGTAEAADQATTRLSPEHPA